MNSLCSKFLDIVVDTFLLTIGLCIVLLTYDDYKMCPVKMNNWLIGIFCLYLQMRFHI